MKRLSRQHCEFVLETFSLSWQISNFYQAEIFSKKKAEQIQDKVLQEQKYARRTSIFFQKNAAFKKAKRIVPQASLKQVAKKKQGIYRKRHWTGKNVWQI